MRLGGASSQTLTEDDALAIAKEVPEVQYSAPSLRGTGQVVAAGTNWSTSFIGVTPDYLEVREWALLAGRGFEATELAGSAKVAIIGMTTLEKLFGEAGVQDPASVLEHTVRVRKVPLTIVGVLERKGQSAQGTDQDDVLVVPLSTARNRLLGSAQGKLRRVGSISIKVIDGQSMKAAEDNIKELLRQRHKLQAGADDDFSVRNLTEILQAQEESSRIMTLLLAAVAGISLLIGGIGIMNIMLVSVTERTREIGLRLAIGALEREVLLQFLIEAVVLASLGGLMGVALATVASLGLAALMQIPYTFDLGVNLLSFAFSAAIGVVFGFVPARRAAQLDPIEALRHE